MGLAVGLGETVGLGFGVGLGVGLGLALGVGQAVAVGLGDNVGVGLTKITLTPSSGTGETIFCLPTTNQAKRIISKITTKAPTTYPNLFACGSIKRIIPHLGSFARSRSLSRRQRYRSASGYTHKNFFPFWFF